MKAGMIFARKTTWRSRLDLEYLDETSRRKASSRQQQNDGPQRTKPLRQFADYASKETLGQVHAGGFLHHLILNFPAFKLRRLPKFTAIVRHCERPFRKRLIPPINPDGSYPRWFTCMRPDYAVRQWLKFALSKPTSNS